MSVTTAALGLTANAHGTVAERKSRRRGATLRCDTQKDDHVTRMEREVLFDQQRDRFLDV